MRCTVSISARLSPRCGTRRSTRAPRSAAEPAGEPSGSSGSTGTSTSRGTAVAGLAAVDLLEQVLDQLAGVTVLDLLDHPAALAADPAAADVEDLDRGLELVLGEGEHVGVGGVAEHDGGLLQGPVERADVVAQPGGPLEVQLGRAASFIRARAA